MALATNTDDFIEAYVAEGEQKALALDNRGPIVFNDDGTLDSAIIDAYWKYGFYVFENVLSREELNDLQTEFEEVIERAPVDRDSDVDAMGRRAIGADLERSTFRFVKPLSDPNGTTGNANGRYEVKMSEPKPPSDAPVYVISNVKSHLQVMDSCLRLYGHPQLLAIAAQINGSDFTPFTESIIVKAAKLGPSVAWHQDGTRCWNIPDWDQGTHGFNFMAQLYGSTAANGVWVLPGSHKQGKIDIKEVKAANHDSDRFADAIPMVCNAGDVVMANRQVLHGSFANTSPDRRVTLNFGFHRRASVLNVYDEERVYERSRLIALAIDARHQRFPDEERYVYQPLAGEEDQNQWSEETRESLLKNYHLKDLGL